MTHLLRTCYMRLRRPIQVRRGQLQTTAAHQHSTQRTSISSLDSREGPTHSHRPPTNATHRNVRNQFRGLYDKRGTLRLLFGGQQQVERG